VERAGLSSLNPCRQRGYSAARIQALHRSIALAQRSEASTTLSCWSSRIALAFLAIERRGQIIDLLAGLAGHDDEAMLEVLLDWRGDEFVDEARLAADLSEFTFDYADMQLKDLKIGVLLHRVSAILHLKRLDRFRSTRGLEFRAAPSAPSELAGHRSAKLSCAWIATVHVGAILRQPKAF
jgi:hypothetical protein